MESIFSLVIKSIEQVWLSVLHNWPFLVLSVVIATVLKLYIDTQKISAFLDRHRRAGVIAATGAAVGTPLCSCGTNGSGPGYDGQHDAVGTYCGLHGGLAADIARRTGLQRRVIRLAVCAGVLPVLDCVGSSRRLDRVGVRASWLAGESDSVDPNFGFFA